MSYTGSDVFQRLKGPRDPLKGTDIAHDVSFRLFLSIVSQPRTVIPHTPTVKIPLITRLRRNYLTKMVDFPQKFLMSMYIVTTI